MGIEILKVRGPLLGTGSQARFRDQRGEAQQLGLTFVASVLGPENGTRIDPPKWTRGTVWNVCGETQNTRRHELWTRCTPVDNNWKPLTKATLSAPPGAEARPSDRLWPGPSKRQAAGSSIPLATVSMGPERREGNS